MLKQISIFLFVLIISNGICQLSMSSPSSPTTSSSPDTPNTPTSTPSSPPLQDSSTTNTDDIVDGDNGSYNSSGQDVILLILVHFVFRSVLRGRGDQNRTNLNLHLRQRANRLLFFAHPCHRFYTICLIPWIF